MKETTKVCRQCGCDKLMLLSSLNKKKCYGCGHEMPWYLEEGQKPVVGPSRTIKRGR